MFNVIEDFSLNVSLSMYKPLNNKLKPTHSTIQILYFYILDW